MTNSDRLLERVRATDPAPAERLADVAASAWGSELRAAIVSSERAASQPAAHASRSRRRLIGPLAIAAAVAVAGGALAAISLREPPAAVRQRITQALSLPAPDRAQLLPAPGGIREVIRAKTPYGEWRVVRTRTQGGHELLSAQPVDPTRARRTGFGIGGCDPSLLPAGGSSLVVCGVGTNTFAVPGLEFVGRAGPDVRGIQARYADGRVVSGYVQNGFFLFLLPGPAPGEGTLVPERLVPLDGSGHELAMNAQSEAGIGRWLQIAASFGPRYVPPSTG
jgi:hypothetical protein